MGDYKHHLARLDLSAHLRRVSRVRGYLAWLAMADNLDGGDPLVDTHAAAYRSEHHLSALLAEADGPQRVPPLLWPVGASCR